MVTCYQTIRFVALCLLLYNVFGCVMCCLLATIRFVALCLLLYNVFGCVMCCLLAGQRLKRHALMTLGVTPRRL